MIIVKCDRCGIETTTWSVKIPKYKNRTLVNQENRYDFCYKCYLDLFEVIEKYLEKK